MAKANWQDPKSSEIMSSHISGLQEAVGKLEESLGISSTAETGIVLSEVYISESDRYRIYQAPEGKRNWMSSPTPIIKKNGVEITTGFIIEYGGGAIVFTPALLSTDVVTVDATYTVKETTSLKTQINSLDIQIQSKASKSYYIDGTNGNDSNDGLSSVTAFKTWAKVRSLIPDNIRIGHSYTIRIIGNLAESVIIDNIRLGYGSSFKLVGDSGVADNHSILSIIVSGCIAYSDTSFSTESIITTNTIIVNSSKNIYIKGCKPRKSAGAGIQCGASEVIIDGCDFGASINNICIYSSFNSHVHSKNNSGNATINGIRAYYGGVVSKEGTQPTGTSANEAVAYGGVIR